VQGAARLAGDAVTLSLPIVAIAEIGSPTEMFRCLFYATTLSAGACIARQTMRKTFRGGQYTPAAYEHCASKKCEQGNAVRARLAGYEPESPSNEAHEERIATAQARLAAIEERLAPGIAEEIAEDLDADIASHAGEQAAAEVAAAVEQAKPEIAARAPVVQQGWDAFRVRREQERAAAEPEAPPVPPPICKADGCRTALRVNNLAGLCRLHRNKVTSRERVGLVPAVARAAGTARNALEGEMAEKKCKFEGCGYALRSDNQSGLCGWHIGGKTTPRPAGWKAPDNKQSLASRSKNAARPASAVERPVRAAPPPVALPVQPQRSAAPLDDELQRIALVLREWRALSPEGRAYLSAATSREELAPVQAEASARLPGRAAR
jgi:hypothetical protein